MPAINLARLKIDAFRLGENFSQPDTFIHQLRELLEYYADRAHRPGQSGLPKPVMRGYRIPGPVLRQILLELQPHAQASRDDTLSLADRLWQIDILEFRLLAASLLGMVSPEPPEPVILRAQAWLRDAKESRLIETLVQKGLARLRREKPAMSLQMARLWLEAGDQTSQEAGLLALYQLMAEPGFDNLPVVFVLIQPLARQAPHAIRHRLVDLLHLLAQRSPGETAYFLRQVLRSAESRDTPWLIRQVLDDFPEDMRQSLRAEAISRR